MPRIPRIIFEGAIYHIYQRGNNKDFIFNNDNHKAFFIKQLKDYNKKFDYQILGYVIMNNHYHLLIKTNKDPIDKIMFSINNVMGKFLSRELSRSGHNYEGRYNSKLVDNKAYLLWLLRYIHRNPLRSKICSDLNDYRWCSHFYYRTGFNSFVDSDFILNIISSSKNNAIRQYINFINNSRYEDDMTTDMETIKKDFSLIEASNLFNYTPSPKPAFISLNDIFESLNFPDDLKISIIKGSKNRSLTSYKIDFIKSALAYKYSLVEISSFINVSPSALGKFVAYHKIAQ